MKKCFHIWDSTGKIVKCYEPLILAIVMTRKKSLNWHIKEWSDGIASGDFSTKEIFEYIEPYNPPDWVYNAITNQTKKAYFKRRSK